jgi:serine/threonine protein kinase
VPPELAAILFRPAESLADLEAAQNLKKRERNIEEEKEENDANKVDELNVELASLASKIKMLKLGKLKEEKLRASDKFDVWSFGVVMYEMLCKRSLLITHFSISPLSPAKVLHLHS